MSPGLLHELHLPPSPFKFFETGLKSPNCPVGHSSCLSLPECNSVSSWSTWPLLGSSRAFLVPLLSFLLPTKEQSLENKDQVTFSRCTWLSHGALALLLLTLAFSASTVPALLCASGSLHWPSLLAERLALSPCVRPWKKHCLTGEASSSLEPLTPLSVFPKWILSSTPLEQGVSRCFCKELKSKYFRLHRPYSILQLLNIALPV